MIELRLIYESGMRTFPPRLPEQPIFYPVLNFTYAEQIARDWNTKSGDLAGYVTRFEIDDGYVARFQRHVVGGREHEELWVPAEQLDEFNQHLVGSVEVTAAYFGPRFRGCVPDQGHLKGRDAVAQLVLLTRQLHVEGVEPSSVVETSNTAIFLHHMFWERHGFSGEGIADDERERVLEEIGNAWSDLFPKIPLTITRR